MNNHDTKYSYTDLTNEKLRTKKQFFKLDIERNGYLQRTSQIYFLKKIFQNLYQEDDPENKNLTYFQKSKFIQGPAFLDLFDGIGQQEKRSKLEEYIIQNSDEYTTVLDAGCNTAVEGFRLYSQGFKGVYTGIDSNLKSLLYAIDNLEGTPGNFTLSDIEKINYPDSYFDIVFTTGVLEGLPYYEKALKEFARLTNKKLIICPWIEMTDKPDLIKKHELVDVYANHYNRKKMYDFLEREGLKNPKIIYREEDPVDGIHEIIIFEKT